MTNTIQKKEPIKLRKKRRQKGKKLIHHPQYKIAGFIGDTNPNLKKEISERIEELEVIHEVQIEL